MNRNTNENVNENGASSYEARIGAKDAVVHLNVTEDDGPIMCTVHDEPLEDETGYYHGDCPGCRSGEPTDDEIYNGYGREGGIAYTSDEPGSLGENDWRL